MKDKVVHWYRPLLNATANLPTDCMDTHRHSVDGGATSRIEDVTCPACLAEIAADTRKTHLGLMGEPLDYLCSSYVLHPVKITNIRERVTCKMCLAQMEKDKEPAEVKDKVIHWAAYTRPAKCQGLFGVDTLLIEEVTCPDCLKAIEKDTRKVHIFTGYGGACCLYCKHPFQMTRDPSRVTCEVCLRSSTYKKASAVCKQKDLTDKEEQITKAHTENSKKEATCKVTADIWEAENVLVLRYNIPKSIREMRSNLFANDLRLPHEIAYELEGNQYCSCIPMEGTDKYFRLASMYYFVTNSSILSAFACENIEERKKVREIITKRLEEANKVLEGMQTETPPEPISFEHSTIG